MAGAIDTGLGDTGLGFYREVLSLRAYRQELLAADIANASTPNFKAVDLDFKQALGATVAAETPSTPQVANRRLWLVSDPRHFAALDAGVTGGGKGADASASVKYQADTQATLDGNTVDLDKEKVTAAANAVDYAATLTFATQTIHMLSTAIGGGSTSSASGT
ncbi:MAG TPA: flagellar basal body rod protein FlgB [Stellaceae bacterium]|jgi:flagellar basal-body rod protein FlgB|nr:flagellar basal body rod protein FlgB [Stellaceae bacterium]